MAEIYADLVKWEREWSEKMGTRSRCVAFIYRLFCVRVRYTERTARAALMAARI